MGKCTIIGKIRIPATVGQAVRINGKKCDEETVWTLTDVYGGESACTDFYIENRSAITFPIAFEVTPIAVEDEYTAGVYLPDGITLVVSPTTVNARTTEHFKLKIDFDKYIMDGEYEVIIEFDFV